MHCQYAAHKLDILTFHQQIAMAKHSVITVSLDHIPVRRKASATIAVVGSPNTGKSTLFNRLTGLHQRTANFPGVTVEKTIGTVKYHDGALELVDLPGLFALSAHSPEERIAADVALGRVPGMERPGGILMVVDSTHLYQGLYLLQQVLELELPVLVALTMTDAAMADGIQIDIAALEQRLGGVAICPVVATSGRGLPALREQLRTLPRNAVTKIPEYWPEMGTATEELGRELPADLPRLEIERALIDVGSDLAREVAGYLGQDGERRLQSYRDGLFGMEPPLAEEARRRYAWARNIMGEVLQSAPTTSRLSSQISRFVNRPLPGTIGLFVVMGIVFQAVFAWAKPLMDMIDDGSAALGLIARTQLPQGAIASFVSDGVIAGVGSVVVFLPQILILFLFIIILEDSGYLARAAYLMDRLMRSIGLSGQSIIPMISSFACAVPGIMASRVIPNRRDRIATILAAPFMTCSARLPVYALLIAAFVPATKIGFINLQGLVLLGLYLLGIAAGLLTALALRQTALRGPKPAFALMLPEFRRPNLRTVLMQLFGRAKAFLKRAGTVIFSVAVVVWALAYYPRSDLIQEELVQRQTMAEQTLSGEELSFELSRLENEASALQLEQSILGRAGKTVEPVFRPLGWDWKITAAVIASFPAREVVIAVLGTVYAIGDEADEATLTDRLTSAVKPDGTPLFTLPMVIGVLIFFAFCLQCTATLAVIRRETNSWRWPLFAWTYMTALGYTGAFLAYQLGS